MKRGHRVLDERGRILRDNLYGTIEEDVWRRDFTANALYYNIEDFSVWDYVGGFDDARNKRTAHDRRSGNALSRRSGAHAARGALRGEARFTIHPETAAPIPKLAWMLDAVPPARLFDEVNKMFLAGSASDAFDLLRKLGLLEHLFPELANVLKDAPDGSAVEDVAAGTARARTSECARRNRSRRLSCLRFCCGLRYSVRCAQLEPDDEARTVSSCSRHVRP